MEGDELCGQCARWQWRGDAGTTSCRRVVNGMRSRQAANIQRALSTSTAMCFRESPPTDLAVAPPRHLIAKQSTAGGPWRWHGR